LAYTAAAYEDTVLTSEAFVRRLEQTVFMAADGNGRVVGTIACSMMSEAEGHLRGIAVQPAWQASGTADRLLQYAEDELIDGIAGESLWIQPSPCNERCDFASATVIGAPARYRTSSKCH